MLVPLSRLTLRLPSVKITDQSSRRLSLRLPPSSLRSVKASSIPATSSRIRLAVLPFQTPFPSLRLRTSQWMWTPTTSGCQISHMDDIAFPLQASCPLELLKKVTSASQILDRHLTSHNLRLNFKPGKTETVLQLRGPASREAGQVITSLGSACLQLSNGQSLRVVSGYKHLGVFFSSSGSMAVELSRRVASAMGAFHDVVKGFLKARVIAVAPKIQVGMATVVSRLPLAMTYLGQSNLGPVLLGPVQRRPGLVLWCVVVCCGVFVCVVCV